jgi:hypothetical protein
VAAMLLFSECINTISNSKGLYDIKILRGNTTYKNFSRIYGKLALLNAQKFKVQRQHVILGYAGCAQCKEITFFLFINGNLCFEKF